MQENLTISNIKWTLSTIPLLMMLAAILILRDCTKGNTILSEVERVFLISESNWVDDFTTAGPTRIYNKLKELVANTKDRHTDQGTMPPPTPWQIYRNLTDVDLLAVFKDPQSRTSGNTIHRPISHQSTIEE